MLINDHADTAPYRDNHHIMHALLTMDTQDKQGQPKVGPLLLFVAISLIWMSKQWAYVEPRPQKALNFYRPYLRTLWRFGNKQVVRFILPWTEYAEKLSGLWNAIFMQVIMWEFWKRLRLRDWLDRQWQSKAILTIVPPNHERVESLMISHMITLLITHKGIQPMEIKFSVHLDFLVEYKTYFLLVWILSQVLEILAIKISWFWWAWPT